MNYEIVALEQLSGRAATIYTILPKGEKVTLFEKFIDEHKTACRDELKEILKRIRQIGQTTGARESFFKHEGDREFVRKYGKYVWALYDEEGRKLRLYCIRFSNVAIILGGGGKKDKSVIKWQEDEKLSTEVRLLMDYATDIFKQLDDGSLKWSKDGTGLEGSLKNYDDGQSN